MVNHSERSNLLAALVVLSIALAFPRPIVAFVEHHLGASRTEQGRRISRTTTTTTTTSLKVDGQNMAGGSRHLLGDVIRSLQPKYLKQVAESIKSNVEGMPKPTTDNLDDFCNSMKAPSSDEIRLTLKQQQTKEEREFRTHLEDGSGPPSALATKRLFGEAKERVVLYRDSAAWCPYCQKVWIALEENAAQWELAMCHHRRQSVFRIQ